MFFFKDEQRVWDETSFLNEVPFVVSPWQKLFPGMWYSSPTGLQKLYSKEEEIAKRSTVLVTREFLKLSIDIQLDSTKSLIFDFFLQSVILVSETFELCETINVLLSLILCKRNIINWNNLIFCALGNLHYQISSEVWGSNPGLGSNFSLEIWKRNILIIH